MSICRFSKDSDVYAYYHVGGFYVVWAEGKEGSFQTAEEVLTFFKKLKEKGVKIPEYAVEELEETKP